MATADKQSWYWRHRPRTLEDVVGQPEAVSVLEPMFKKGKIPHVLLFTGPSGVGKTTLARIIKRQLNVMGTLDFQEIDSASFRGIDTIREIKETVDALPMTGDARMWIFDEIHQQTKDAQNAMLKFLEDPPDHAYFVLCTTDPQKLIETVKTRCFEIKLKSVSDKEIKKAINRVAEAENVKLTADVMDRLVDVAEGSVRRALVKLEQIAGIKDEDERLNCLHASDHKQDAIEIFRVLGNEHSTWADITKLLKDVKKEEVEGIRHLVLACATNMMLNQKGREARAALIINAFRDNYYDCGKAGLLSSCWYVLRPQPKKP